MRLYAIEVSDTDCLTLCDLLQRDGRADGLSAASAIDRRLSLQAKLIALTTPERDAILAVLEDPPRRARRVARRVGAGSPRPAVAVYQSSTKSGKNRAKQRGTRRASNASQPLEKVA